MSPMVFELGDPTCYQQMVWVLVQEACGELARWGDPESITHILDLVLDWNETTIVIVMMRSVVKIS